MFLPSSCRFRLSDSTARLGRVAASRTGSAGLFESSQFASLAAGDLAEPPGRLFGAGQSYRTGSVLP
ncbi:hypothetical protein J31TS4_21840 [Paenibacillus sp. J31TS4]|nr:hypothetical protein J31TS4_21840 [Paenibacillus sp. J31TS4]